MVQAQLDALRTDDAAAAFALAAPGLREQLDTPERFMAMVRAGYPMLIRPASTSFLEPALIDGDVAQGVRITDATGRVPCGWPSTACSANPTSRGASVPAR